ncbi:MAG: AI-2E family transporter [Motilibacteraceae bacterium]
MTQTRSGDGDGSAAPEAVVAAGAPVNGARATSAAPAGTTPAPAAPQPARSGRWFAKTTAVIVLVTIGIVVLAALVYQVRTVLLTVFIGFFLAAGFEPLLQWMERHGMRRGLAVLTFFIGLLLFLTAFVFLTLTPAVQQLNELAQSLPDLVKQVSDKSTPIGDFLSRSNVQDAIQNALKSVPGYLASSVGTVFGIIGAIVGTLFTLFTVLTLMIYFMLAMPRIRTFAARVLRHPERVQVAEEALGKVGGYVTGQLTICLCAGITSYIYFTVAGVPYSAVLALLVALFDAIPQVGATLGAVVASVVALSDSVALCLVTIGWFVIYQQVENYLIAPRLFSKAVNLSPVAVFVAILVGAGLAGVVGALVALPLTAALKTVFSYTFRDRLGRISGSGGSGPRVHHAGDEDPVHVGEQRAGAQPA